MTARQRSHRRTYGAVRKLTSGRFQAHYTGPDGQRRNAPATFATRPDADTWLAGQRTDLARGTWRAPELGTQPLAEYAERWLAARVDLAPRTAALYADLLARWIIAPQLLPGPRGGRGIAIEVGKYEVRAVTAAAVREWNAAVVAGARASAQKRATRAAGGNRAGHPARAWAATTGKAAPATGRPSRELLARWVAAGSPDIRPKSLANPDAGRTQAAQAYRLLSTILADAVREQLLPENPCQIPRASSVRAAERVPASAVQVQQIAAAAPRRYAAAVTLAAWSGLRAGELFALTRRHVDLVAGTVRVERALIEVPGEPLAFGPTKSEAGRRTVHLPRIAVAAIAEHLAEFTGPAADALVFTTGQGNPVRGARRTSMFHRARAAAGRPDLRWHDLRHTGATLAADTGASLKALQRRMGHSTVRAALIYQHAGDAADAQIARRLDELTGTGNVVPLRTATRT